MYGTCICLKFEVIQVHFNARNMHEFGFISELYPSQTRFFLLLSSIRGQKIVINVVVCVCFNYSGVIYTKRFYPKHFCCDALRPTVFVSPAECNSTSRTKRFMLTVYV